MRWFYAVGPVRLARRAGQVQWQYLAGEAMFAVTVDVQRTVLSEDRFHLGRGSIDPGRHGQDRASFHQGRVVACQYIIRNALILQVSGDATRSRACSSGRSGTGYGGSQ